MTASNVVVKISYNHDQSVKTELFRSTKSQLTEEAILPIALPATPLLKFLAEDQERVIGDGVAVMRLPLPLDPDNPYVSGVDTGWNESEEAKNNIEPEVDAEAFGEPDGEWWQEQAQDEADDLACGVFAHLC